MVNNKCIFRMVIFLNVVENLEIRKHLFRISAYKLAIEQGQYKNSETDFKKVHLTVNIHSNKS